MNRKIKNIFVAKADAFTLPELVVSMLIMAILFTFGASVYMILLRQSQGIYKKNSFYSDYFVTKKAMERDVEQAFLITVSDENTVLRLQQADQPAASDIFYKIDTGYIVRVKGESSDTLLPGGKIAAIEKLNDSIPLIRLLTIQHYYNQKPFYTHLQKNYSSEQLLRSPSISNPLP